MSGEKGHLSGKCEGIIREIHLPDLADTMSNLGVQVVGILEKKTFHAHALIAFWTNRWMLEG